MMRNRLFVSLLAFGAIAWLGAPPLHAQNQQTRITVAVECGAQGVVDQDWTIEFDLCDAAGNKVNTKGPIKVSVPDGTGSRSAAERMKTAINAVAPGAATREETTHKKYGGETGELKAEDLVLHGGHTIKNVITRKEGKKKHGHLKVYNGKKRINNQLIGNVARESGLDEAHIPGMSSAVIMVGRSNVAFYGVEVLITVLNPDGTTTEMDYETTFPGTDTPTEVTTAIGDWAQSQGIPVDYPTSSSVRLLFPLSGLDVDTWSFTLYPAEPDDDTLVVPVPRFSNYSAN
jgi:hypothetical protein